MSNIEQNNSGKNLSHDQMTPGEKEAMMKKHCEGRNYHFTLDGKAYTVDYFAFLTANTKKTVLKLPDGRLFSLSEPGPGLGRIELITSVDEGVEQILEAKEV
jgi:hypothetical protein